MDLPGPATVLPEPAIVADTSVSTQGLALSSRLTSMPHPPSSVSRVLDFAVSQGAIALINKHFYLENPGTK